MFSIHPLSQGSPSSEPDYRLECKEKDNFSGVENVKIQIIYQVAAPKWILSTFFIVGPDMAPRCGFWQISIRKNKIKFILKENFICFHFLFRGIKINSFIHYSS